MAIVIAMDGPSGAGKSSTSKALAIRANWDYLDTGALYRGATWLALKENIKEAGDLLYALDKSQLRFEAKKLQTQFLPSQRCQRLGKNW